MSKAEQQNTPSASLLVVPFILITALIFSLIIISDYRNFEKRFSHAAEKIHVRFQYYLQQNEVVLEGFSSFIAGVGDVDKNVIDHYTKKLKLRFPHIYMFEIAEEVKGSTVKNYIQNKKDNENIDFEIMAFEHDGDRVWSEKTKKEKYFPLIYLYPTYENTKKVLGLDLTSSKTLNVALNEALIGGDYATSLPFTLFEGGKAFAMFKKVDIENKITPYIAMIIVTTDSFVFDLSEYGDALELLVYHNRKDKDDSLSHFIKKGNSNNYWFPISTYESMLVGDSKGLILHITKPFQLKDISWILLLIITQILVSLFFVVRGVQIKNSLVKNKLQNASQQKYKMEAISNLTGGIAHEFNNNLSVTRGFLSLLSGRENDMESMSWLNHIDKATEKSIELTRKLLTYSRYNGVRERVSNIVLSEEINRIKLELSSLVNEKVELKFELADSLCTVLLSEIDLKEILVELINNANDAIASNEGLIIISTNKTHLLSSDNLGIDHKVKVVEGDYILLSVSDNGIGVDDEIKSHIFDPFFTTKEFGKSSGMGLASVYGLVKLANGYISCYPNKPKGNILNIYLPILN